MRDFYKNIYFYLIMIPLLAGVWTATAATLSLPTAEKQFERKVDDWNDSKQYIFKILALDSGRLEYNNSSGDNSGEFAFRNVINKFTEENKIPASGYSLRAGTILKKGTRKIRTADMTIDNIDIVKFAEFVTNLTARWSNLQIETLTISNLQDGPDVWKATLKLTYTY